jgi:hypothetical protein
VKSLSTVCAFRLRVWSLLPAVLFLLITSACNSAAGQSVPAITPIIPAATSTPTGTVPARIAEMPNAKPGDISLIGVGFATDGNYIMVSSRALPEIASRWQQGDVYLIDEKDGAVYDQIPVMPVVGPLFGKPKIKDQPGMLCCSI